MNNWHWQDLLIWVATALVIGGAVALLLMYAPPETDPRDPVCSIRRAAGHPC